MMYQELVASPTPVKEEVIRICRDSAEEEHAINRSTSQCFNQYKGVDLKIPPPVTIRVGKAGGLPFDSLTTDLFLGCLPPSRICYGSCFAAKAAFEAGYDYGTRVANTLEPDILARDIAQLPVAQMHLRNGWNSDPSWNWQQAGELAKLVYAQGKHLIFITKAFLAIKDEEMPALIESKAEIRVSLSAFDTKPQLNHRLHFIQRYRDAGGTIIPHVMSTYFKNPALNKRQDDIVQYTVKHDFPAAENSLRFPSDSPVLDSLDTSIFGRTSDNGDYWCGRLFPEQLQVPTTTSIPSTYKGLESPYLSANSHQFLSSLWFDTIPTNDQVRGSSAYTGTTQSGVSRTW